MSVNLYFDDILNAKPIRSAGFSAQSAYDFISKLLDGASRRPHVARREERYLAVRPHRLSGVEVGLIEHRYFHDIIWAKNERRSLRPQARRK